MTPKMSGAMDALKQLRSYVDDESVKLTKRIMTEAMPAVKDGFKTAHGSVDSAHSSINEIVDFANDLKKSNGGGEDDTPLDGSGGQSSGTSTKPPPVAVVAGTDVEESPPRSSDVAAQRAAQ